MDSFLIPAQVASGDMSGLAQVIHHAGYEDKESSLWVLSKNKWGNSNEEVLGLGHRMTALL